MNLKEIGKKFQPSEVAKYIFSLSGNIGLHAFQTLPLHTQVKVFSHLDFSLQVKIISGAIKERASFLLNELNSDDRMAFFSLLKVLERNTYLDMLSERNREAVDVLLVYPDNSVARLIDTDFATISSELTIAEAAKHLRQYHKDTEAANVIYVVDHNGKLVDDIPVRRFVMNEPEVKIADILDGHCVSLHMNDSLEDAINKFKEYDRVVLPVIDSDSQLMGVVTVDDVIDVAEKKDTKQIQNFGGLESLDHPYVKTGFFALIRKRASWLIVLFLGETLTATAMAHYDMEMSRAVVLAMFVPLIISSGGNSGSQAATLIIRAMALKELGIKDWWFVMRREILSGLTLGILLGVIGFTRITIWQNMHLYNYGPHWVLLAFTVSLSLIGIVMWGTLSGSMIPVLLKKFKLDPATSSAPLVATLVDVTGLVIYFSIAAIILKGTLL